MKTFRLQLIIRVIGLILIIWGIKLTSLQEDPKWMTQILLWGLMIGLVVELIYFVEKTNRDLSNFLLGIKYKDFTQTFYEGKQGKSFTLLHNSFNQIINSFQDLRAEKESHYQYLQYVVEQVRVALICYNTEGEVVLMNQAAKEILGRPHLKYMYSLQKLVPELYEVIQEIKAGEGKLIKFVVNGQLKHVSVQASAFSLQDQGYTLLSLQDIRQELDEKEMESWQKLIRVLTHEIMNSVTPIISLSGVIHEYLADEDNQAIPLATIPESHAEDMLQGIQTIEKRSKGLLQFVKAYRNLTRIPPPEFEMVDLVYILQQILVLLKAELETANIEVETELPEELSIYADAKLLEQVFINLIKNAMEAVAKQEQGRIKVQVFTDPQQKVVIQIQDNGPGIPLELQDKLFIPFFTTKSQGSGIGLSLSQQIIRIHKGEITFKSERGKGSVFTISL